MGKGVFNIMAVLVKFHSLNSVDTKIYSIIDWCSQMGTLVKPKV